MPEFAARSAFPLEALRASDFQCHSVKKRHCDGGKVFVGFRICTDEREYRDLLSFDFRGCVVEILARARYSVRGIVKL